MNKEQKNSRRDFLKKAAIGTAAIASTSVVACSEKTTKSSNQTSNLNSKKSTILKQPNFNFNEKYSANDTIQVATIGMGIMGFNNIEASLKVPGVKLVAACDLYDGRMERTKEVYGNDIFTHRNYEAILERKDIDAVIISTSDHWHIPIAKAALAAGKAVYCEKPMIHKIAEGKDILAAHQKHPHPFQVGSQRVSSVLYAKAKEIYERGDIGELTMVETFNDRQSALGAWQYSIPTDASPKTVDWQRFLGSAPKRDFDKVRFFRWRNYQDYGTGVAGDLFVHLFSGMHLVLSSNGPERVFASGGLRYWKDGRDVPDVMIGCCDYPETKTHPAFNTQIRVNFIDGKGGGSLQRFVGTEGVMDINWGNIVVKRRKMKTAPGYGGWDTFETFTEAQQKEYKKWYQSEYGDLPTQMSEPTEMEYKIPKGYREDVHHHANFYDAIRNGTKIVEDVAYGLRAAAPSLAMNKSYFEKKIIKWNPDKMELES